MITRTVTLHASGGATLATLIVRDSDANTVPLRNLEGVQPPGSTVQGAFGDGVLQVGALERDFATCSTGVAPAADKAALDAALASTTSIRVDGFSLPIAGVPGITEWARMRAGIRARIRFIPAAAEWTLVSDGVTTATGLL
jgi:hypothetical protein